LDISIHSRDIHTKSGKESEITPNLACFSPSKFFQEQAFKFLDWDYKIERASAHVLKFCVDWPRDLGDLTLKKIKKNK